MKTFKEEYPFESRYHLVESRVKMHYVDEGPVNKNPILMIHGNPTWSFFYRNIIKNFKDQHRVIAPDHIGMGFSDKPQDYDYKLEQRIADLKHFIEGLDLQNITLIVHDWGGPIGLGVAELMPERFKNFVILNTAAFHINTLPKRIALCRMPVVGPFLIKKLNAFSFGAVEFCSVKPLFGGAREGYLRPYQTPEERIAIHEFIQDIPLEEQHPSRKLLNEIEEKLTSLKGPKLILWGARDFCFHDQFYDYWRKVFPEARSVYLSNAGHYLVEDSMPEIVKELKIFIK